MLVRVTLLVALLCGGALALQAAPKAASQAPVAVSVNVNAADAEELSTRLDGVGTSKAKAIIAYRQQHGKFSSLEDLLAVRGIGERLLQTNKDRIRFSGK